MNMPWKNIRGIGPTTATALQRLGFSTVNDIIEHWPVRYQDFSNIVPLSDCPHDTPVTVCATITKLKSRRSWKNRRLALTEATITDDTATAQVTWFNQPYLAQQLKIGQQVFLAGQLKTTKYGSQFSNPLVERLSADPTHTARLIPIYSTTKGITQKQWRYFIKQLLEQGLPEWVPESILEPTGYMPYQTAVTKIHFPDHTIDVTEAKQRLAFNELLLIQLFSQLTRQDLAQALAPVVKINTTTLKTFTTTLPWPLTQAQRRAVWDIVNDMTKPHPMNRLLEGDVGSGKTVVAAMVMYHTAQAGYQSVLMAPTEILAQQHFQRLNDFIIDPNIKLALWTSQHRVLRLQGARHTKVDPVTLLNQADIIIGTQALIQKHIVFKRLALAIIDEQHRFGVAQRHRLQQINTGHRVPHLLSMTATPIPRSLALTVYGDLMLSILDQRPQQRRSITTSVITENSRAQMYQAMLSHIQRGEQVYVVAPRIEESETTSSLADEVTSVMTEFNRLQKIFPNHTIAVLHGKLHGKDKEQLMADFSSGKINILISTTVIEVGVDVPNATMIIIEAADHFGLAQLHQLRGRVGRCDKPSVCYVTYASPTVAAQERLAFFAATTDGFALAEYDLQKRGPGDVYGQAQSGFLNQLKMARLTDYAIIKQAQQAAVQLLPNLKQYPRLQERLDQFIQAIHLE